MSSDWNVDAYKNEFENDEHWQLRRNFMLAHKDKFSEDELVCLSQVFTNVEFLGCRYPDKTMIRVAELAKGVVEKYREQRKNSLKRTFVAASDAASAKVKGLGFKEEGAISLKRSKVMTENDESSNENAKKIAQRKETEADSRMGVIKYGGVKTFNIKGTEKAKACPHNETGETFSTSEKEIIKTDGPIGNFVLILGNINEHPVQIIQRNSALNKCTIRWDFEEDVNRKAFLCKLFLNDVCVATSTGVTMKVSKEHTAMVAIAKLRESYYGIKVKVKFFSDKSISHDQISGCSKNSASNQLGEDNVGRKLMKLMGWEGGGLGNKGQGIEEPLSAQLHIKREGLGLSNSNKSLALFRKKARDYVKTWINSNSDQDLVFSSEFTVEERKILHGIALQFSLKSKSYGKEPNRQVVFCRKSEPWEILKELLKTGGDSNKYELLYPTNS